MGSTCCFQNDNSVSSMVVEMEKKDPTFSTEISADWNSKSEVKSAFLEFSESTSFHGIKNAFGNDRPLIIRIVWVCLVLGGLTVSAINISSRVRYYMETPTSVDVKVNYVDHMEFPSVTICNANAFRRTLAAKSGHKGVIDDLFGKGNKTALELHSNITLFDLYTQNGHRKEDLIYSCKWRGKQCSADYFRPVLTEFGLCYTFDGGNETKRIDEAGVEQGLALVLNVEQYDHMPGPHYGVGIKLLIHEDDSFPMPSGFGKDLPTGRQGFVNIKTTKEYLLPHPYGICSNDTGSVYDGYRYSKGSCMKHCQSDFIISQCGCSEYYVPSFSDSSRACTVGDMNCTKEAKEQYIRKGHSRCTCPVFCSKTSFDPYISYGSISEFAFHEISADDALIQKQHEAKHESFQDTQENEDFRSIHNKVKEEVIRHIERLQNEWNNILKEIDTWMFAILDDFYAGFINYIPNIVREFELVTLPMIEEEYVKNRESLNIPEIGLLSSYISATSEKIADDPNSNFTSDLTYIQQLLSDLYIGLDYAYSNMTWLKSQEVEFIFTMCSGQFSERNPDIVEIAEFFLYNRWGCALTTLYCPSAREFNDFIDELKTKTDLIYNNSLSVEISDLDRVSNIIADAEYMITIGLKTISNYKTNSLLYCINGNIELLNNLNNYLKESLSLNKVGVCERDNSVLEKFATIRNYFVDLVNNFEMYFGENITMTQLSEHIISRESEYYRDTLFWLIQEITEKKPDDRARLCGARLNASLNIIWKMNTIVPSFSMKVNVDRLARALALDPLQKVDTFNFSTYSSVFNYMKKASKHVWETCQEFYKSLTVNEEFYSHNFLHLNVFFHELSQQEFSQQNIYDIFALLGDIGGSLGLFLGASVMSVFELWDLVAALVIIFMKRKRKLRNRNADI